MADGWIVFMDQETGETVINEPPIVYDAPRCDPRGAILAGLNGGEADVKYLFDQFCVLYTANLATPAIGSTVVAPRNDSRPYDRLIFTYAGPVGQPEANRLIAIDLIHNEGFLNCQSLQIRV